MLGENVNNDIWEVKAADSRQRVCSHQPGGCEKTLLAAVYFYFTR